MRRNDVLNNPLLWVIGGALLSTWLYGVFHTYTTHDAGRALTALLLPPYGLYMAVEQSLAHSASAGALSSLPVADVVQENAAACRGSETVQQQLGLGDHQFATFCTCVWQYFMDNYPAGENDYVDQYGKNSPELEAVKKRAANTCLITAQKSDATRKT